MQRGEIWWADLEPPAGRRPVLLLSRNESYAVRDYVIVALVTTRIRHIPSEVTLNTADGMPRECVVNIDTITTIAKARLRERLAVLSSGKIKDVSAVIHFVLGLDD
jgi:mRNA interferase MazF